MGGAVSAANATFKGQPIKVAINGNDVCVWIPVFARPGDTILVTATVGSPPKLRFRSIVVI